MSHAFKPCLDWPKLYKQRYRIKDQTSHLEYLNICIKQQTYENLSSIGRRSSEIIMKEKTPLSHEVACFQMLDFKTSNSNSEVSKSNSRKITSLSKSNVCHFRLSRFSQCFILSSTALHCLLACKFFYANNYFEYFFTNSVHCLECCTGCILPQGAAKNKDDKDNISHVFMLSLFLLFILDF